MAHCDSTAARSTVTMCYIAHKGGICVHEASRLEQPVDSAVAETRLNEWLTFVDCKTHMLLVTENLVIAAETEPLIERQKGCIETETETPRRQRDYGGLLADFSWEDIREAESKEKHGVWDPMPELTITSFYVHSRVDSNTFTMSNPMPESTLTLWQSRLHPRVRDFGFGLKWIVGISREEKRNLGLF